MDNLQKEFEKIYDQFSEKIYRFVFLKVNSQEIAQDLTSEAFLRCWNVYKQDPKQIESIQPFIYKVARNLVYDHYRSKGKAPVPLTEECLVVDSSDIDANISQKSDMEKVKAVLANITNTDYQDMIIWHYVEDLSVPEIAQITGKPEGTVRVMIHRALKEIKSQINREV